MIFYRNLSWDSFPYAIKTLSINNLSIPIWNIIHHAGKKILQQLTIYTFLHMKYHEYEWNDQTNYSSVSYAVRQNVDIKSATLLINI